MIINKILGTLGFLLLLLSGTFILAAYGILFKMSPFSYNAGYQSWVVNIYLFLQIIFGIVVYFLITKGDRLEEQFDRIMEQDETILDVKQESTEAPNPAEQVLVLLMTMLNLGICLSIGGVLLFFGNQTLGLFMVKYLALFHLVIAWEMLKLFFAKREN